MGETTRQHRDRRRRYRAADRRRRAEQQLRTVAAVADYAAGQLADGLAPEAARRAALEAAGELAAAAVEVRRLARADPALRRLQARMLRAQGMAISEVAWRVGVSETCVRNYLRR